MCIRDSPRSAFRGSAREERCPWIRTGLEHQLVAVGLSHVAANCVVLKAVNPSLSLLEVDRIRRQVPVDDRMAVEVKIKALLPDRGGGEDEWPERRVCLLYTSSSRPLAAATRKGRAPCVRGWPWVARNVPSACCTVVMAARVLATNSAGGHPAVLASIVAAGGLLCLFAWVGWRFGPTLTRFSGVASWWAG